MSPQFDAAASTPRTEVERITDEERHVNSGGAVASSVDINHLPS